MSVRYGISLILEPAFTAGLHRARQVICSQYGCWAAEMHSVHLPLTGYFACPEPEAPSLGAALEKIAAEFRIEHPHAFLVREGTIPDTEGERSIYLAFTDGNDSLSEPDTAGLLQAEVAEVLSRLNLTVGAETIPLRFALLKHSGLPGQVFQSAARFAEGVVRGLELPARVALSELALFRYESAAAGEDWEEGGWAVDLSWQIIGSYPLANVGSE